VPSPDSIATAKYIALETYRRSGQPVSTPVLVVEDGAVYYVRTDPRSGKVKRIRRNPHVRIAPASFRGKVDADWVDGRASIVTQGAQVDHVQALFRAKYGLRISLLEVWHSITRMPSHAIIAIETLPASTGGGPAGSTTARRRDGL
jgi:PPOX class probable F420-dependent enzyme